MGFNEEAMGVKKLFARFVDVVTECEAPVIFF